MVSSGVQPLIRYCAKTNNEAHILGVMASLGSHVMVSHEAESELALTCGFSPDKVAYQRPVFLESEVRSVLEKGVSLIHIYRNQDIPKIASLADQLKKQVQISLRLCVDSLKTRLHPLNFPARRLGMGENELIEAAKTIANTPNLELKAINFYAGTQKTSPENFRTMLRKTSKITSKLKDLDIPVQEINVGGGVPSTSMRKANLGYLFRRRQSFQESAQTTTELGSFGEQLANIFIEKFARVGIQQLSIMALEPGRSLVGNTTILITRVNAIQGNWAFLDASLNYLGESPLPFWRCVLPAILDNTPPGCVYHLSGSTLNTMDVLSVFRRLPLLHERDLLVLADAGAYSISRASRYADLPPSINVLGIDGSLKFVRNAEIYGDLSAAMVI
jgi:diaminopimelate decarboxylase